MRRFAFSFLLAVCALAPFAEAHVVVIGRLARQSSIQPGEAFEGVIQLKNLGAEPAEVRVEQTDYSFRADGTNDYGEPGKSPRSNANWMSVTPNRVKLAPGEMVPVRYKGRAPVDAKLRGTYWSMIMVEPLGAAALPPPGGPQQVAVGLQTAVRFGVQIVTEVGQGTRSLQVLQRSLHREGPRQLLQLDLGNDGERVLIPTVSLELFDLNGRSVRRTQVAATRIYPGCSVRAEIDLSGVPAGKYAAMLLLDSGDAQAMGAQYELELQP